MIRLFRIHISTSRHKNGTSTERRPPRRKTTIKKHLCRVVVRETWFNIRGTSDILRTIARPVLRPPARGERSTLGSSFPRYFSCCCFRCSSPRRFLKRLCRERSRIIHSKDNVDPVFRVFYLFRLQWTGVRHRFGCTKGNAAPFLPFHRSVDVEKTRCSNGGDSSWMWRIRCFQRRREC